MRTLLIVGIDPGTTSAYAILDIDGRLVRMCSAKNKSFSNIVTEIVDFGKVLIVGTDKKKSPEFVQRFAVKTGANH